MLVDQHEKMCNCSRTCLFSQWFIDNMFAASQMLHQPLSQFSVSQHYCQLHALQKTGKTFVEGGAQISSTSLYNFKLQVLYNTWDISHSYDSNFQITIEEQENLSSVVAQKKNERHLRGQTYPLQSVQLPH